MDTYLKMQNISGATNLAFVIDKNILVAVNKYGFIRYEIIRNNSNI